VKGKKKTTKRSKEEGRPRREGSRENVFSEESDQARRAGKGRRHPSYDIGSYEKKIGKEAHGERQEEGMLLPGKTIDGGVLGQLRAFYKENFVKEKKGIRRRTGGQSGRAASSEPIRKVPRGKSSKGRGGGAPQREKKGATPMDPANDVRVLQEKDCPKRKPRQEKWFSAGAWISSKTKATG